MIGFDRDGRIRPLEFVADSKVAIEKVRMSFCPMSPFFLFPAATSHDAFHFYLSHRVRSFQHKKLAQASDFLEEFGKVLHQHGVEHLFGLNILHRTGIMMADPNGKYILFLYRLKFFR